MGQIEHGVYIDDMEGIDPDTISRYYGNNDQAQENQTTSSRNTHSSHSGSESESSTTDRDNALIAERQERFAQNFNSEDSVQVPSSESPFTEEDLEAFSLALSAVSMAGFVPNGYGLREDERESGSYPTVETLNSGRRGRREIVVGLPEHIWYSRALLWAQGLDVLNRTLHTVD